MPNRSTAKPRSRRCPAAGRAAALLAAGLAAAAPARAIVGPASDGEAFSDRVVMVLKRAANTAGFCSGVVVAADAVLTAAHCVGSIADTRVHFRDADGSPVLLPVAAIAVHPQYRASALRTRQRSIDLALVRLAASLPSRFAPALLAAAQPVAVGQPLRIAGFGIAQENAERSGGTLRAATLAVRAPLSSILLWANDPAGRGAGACTGDSGAPIFAADGHSVLAIASWASGNGAAHCGDLTQGALIGPQRGWIDATLRRWGLEP